MSRENRARIEKRLAQKADAWLSEFGKNIQAREEEQEGAFERACDRANEERKKHNCGPYITTPTASLDWVSFKKCVQRK